ncbi:hypothetical protein D3C78_731440 [compost metagenome]
MLDDHPHDAGRHRLHLAADGGELVQQHIQGNPRAVELHPGAEHPGVEHPQVVAGELDQAQLTGAVHVVVGEVGAEQCLHFVEAQAGRLHLVPGANYGLLQAQHVSQVAALLPGFEQFADAGDTVATLQQLADQPQPRQMPAVIDTNPPAPLRRRQQAAILVGAQIAHRGTGLAGQFIHRVFGIRRGRGFGGLVEEFAEKGGDIFHGPDHSPALLNPTTAPRPAQPMAGLARGAFSRQR